MKDPKSDAKQVSFKIIIYIVLLPNHNYHNQLYL